MCVYFHANVTKSKKYKFSQFYLIFSSISFEMKCLPICPVKPELNGIFPFFSIFLQDILGLVHSVLPVAKQK